MNEKLEDVLGKASIIIVFALLAVWQARSIVTILAHRDEIPLWALVLTSRVSGLIFIALTVALTIIRLAPRRHDQGLAPRLTAVLGTHLMMLLVVVPSNPAGPVLQTLSTALTISGTLASIWCAVHLGRSFSIMATARRLVTEGPYSVVRHPLYVAEAITIVGIILGHGTLMAVILGLCWFILQFRRALNEERVLRATFPEYERYANEVPRFLPLKAPW